MFLSVLIFSLPIAARQAPRSSGETPSQKLERLARGLREDKSAVSYDRLNAWARSPGSGELGVRAALALGYFDYQKGRYAEARSWLIQAERDPLLREYALYWKAEAERAAGRYRDAFADLESFRKEYPESVMTEQALASLGESALAADQPATAVAALEAYPRTQSSAKLLFLLARAQEQSGHREAASASYLSVYEQFPLNVEAEEAGQKARSLARSLGQEFPAVPLPQQIARAEMLYLARRWKEARNDYADLIPRLGGTERDRAKLHVDECRAELGAPPSVLEHPTYADPQLDAERLYYLAQAERSRNREREMLAAIEQAVQRGANGPWAEEALFAGGNYFWVNLDREDAAAYYRRLLEAFPMGKAAAIARWRIAWVAYLDGRPDAPALFEQQLERYPTSPLTVDVLYWSGRAAERAGALPRARAFYHKAAERFPQTYFGRAAADRLRAIGAEPEEAIEALAGIPHRPNFPELGGDIPAAASARWERAKALRMIAFDSSAELELRAAYAATGAVTLQVEAARAAADAGHYMAAAALIRLGFPELESQPYSAAPPEIWRLVYPLPFAAEIRNAAARAGVDPMLVAGVIRQESGFDADAVSHAGAVGLMQLLPKTARKLARSLRVGYSRKKLLQPGYNLRLGARYLADLIRSRGSLEAALAVYNAGEDRVTAWQASRSFAEPAEFVESIPFTETREYVEIVSRNAEIYRQFYGGAQ